MLCDEEIISSDKGLLSVVISECWLTYAVCKDICITVPHIYYELIVPHIEGKEYC